MTSTQKENRKLWIIFIIALLIALLPWVLLAQDIKKEKFNLYKEVEDEVGYVQAVRVGNTIYISGTVGSGDMQNAVKQAYDELGKTLKNYGADFGNVVKENVFTTDLDAFKLQIDQRKKYYQGDFPSASWIQVARLFDPELIVEIEVIAVLPDK